MEEVTEKSFVVPVKLTERKYKKFIVIRFKMA